MPRPRSKKPQPSTVEDQQGWLEQWMLPTSTGSRSRAERTAKQLVRTMGHAAGEAEADLLVLEAVERARRRLQRRLTTKGAIDPVGQGFPAYCRVVLHNEVRRQLAGRARQHARQVEPQEALTVLLDAYDNLIPVPLHTVDSLILGANAWSHKWYRGHVERLESTLDAGSLEVASGLYAERLRVADRDALSPPLELALPVHDVVQLRLKNHTIVGLHVRIDLLGYDADGSPTYLPRPRSLVRTQRGIGLGVSTVTASGASSDRGAPWEYLATAPGPANPRRIAQRTFTPCQISSAEAARLLAEVLSGLAPTPSSDSGAWLSQANARLLGSRVLSAPRPSGPDAGLLLCGLAEWAEPGLHDPHRRDDHRGGHPLADEIRAAVLTLQIERGTGPDVRPNTLRQARSRLARMVQESVAQAARNEHSRS